jgi:ribosomal-protein-alanine N-acetyltransferase
MSTQSSFKSDRPERIETARLVLRPFRSDDVDEMHSLWTDPDVRRFLWDNVTISREQAQEVVTQSIELFESRGIGFWVVYLLEPDAPDASGDRGSGPGLAGVSAGARPIGFCGLRPFGEGEPQEIELLYGLRPEYWRRGLATEAASAMLQFGFDVLRLQRIYAGADPPNAASFRVMERIGMKFVRRIQLGETEAIYYVRDIEDSWGTRAGEQA